jgi:micrococcal nuclease
VSLYEYKATLLAVVDGDTIDVDIDLGLDVHIRGRVRLNGCDAPEKRTPEGMAALTFTRAWLATAAQPFIIRTHKREKFGRYLADVLDEERDLVADLIAAGHAKPWDGQGPKP